MSIYIKKGCHVSLLIGLVLDELRQYNTELQLEYARRINSLIKEGKEFDYFLKISEEYVEVNFID